MLSSVALATRASQVGDLGSVSEDKLGVFLVPFPKRRYFYGLAAFHHDRKAGLLCMAGLGRSVHPEPGHKERGPGSLWYCDTLQGKG